MTDQLAPTPPPEPLGEDGRFNDAQLEAASVNGHLKVPICGHEKSPPVMAGSGGLRWPTSSRPSLLHPEGIA
jgi:hypothetical protein